MPDDTITIWVGGRRYRGPSKMLERMQRDGVAFSLRPPEASPPPTAQPDMSGQPPDTGDQGGGFLETIGDAARGAAHGATFGLADHIPGTDINPTEALGLDPYDQVRERSPVASTVGDVAGSVLSPVSKLGMAAKGAGLAARAGRAALAGAGEGALRAAAEGNDPTMGGVIGGVAGGGLAAAAPAVGKAIGAVGGKVAPWLGRQADKARARAVGVLGTESKQLADKFGIGDTAREVADLVERVAPSGPMGMSAADRAKMLQQQLDSTYGPAIDDVLTEGSQQGLDAFVPQGWADIAARLRKQIGDMPTDTAKSRALRNAVEGNVDNFGAAPKDLIGLRRAKSRWQGDAYGDSLSISDTAANKAAGMQGHEAEMALDDIMSHALPETERKFHQANKDYGERALLAGTLGKRAAVEETDTALPALASGALGVLATGSPWGAIMALLTGTRNQTIQAMSKSQGLDALANIARKGSRELPQLEQKLAPVTGAIGDAMQRPSGLIGGYLSPDDEDERGGSW